MSSITNVAIDHEAVLKAVGLNVRDPSAQALLLTCQRYGLDPVLKHMCLIQNRPYVTRDGLLHVAHSSGKFDGIEVLEVGETQTHYTAKVAVYRKDMSRPFTYPGRYPKSGPNKGYGPEMAIKTAECCALRRAFNVALCAREEVWEQDLESHAMIRDETVVEETFVRPKKVSDNRSLPQLIQDGVDKVNNDFAEEHGGENIVNGFEVTRHLLKTAVEEERITDPGKVAQGKCNMILNHYYGTPEGRAWVRHELPSYLAKRLEEARREAAEEPEEPAQETYEDEVVSAASALAREPGEEG